MAARKGEGLVRDYMPSTDVTSGDIVTIGNWVGVAADDIDSGDLGAVAVSGLFQLEDSELDGSASDYSDGDPVFLSTGEYFGIAVEDGGDTATGELRAILIQNTQSDT